MNLTSTAGRASTAPRAVSGDAAADDQLAVDARDNPESFGPLYTRHVEAVYRYLRARGASDDEASELVAVAFERALRNIHRYRLGGGGFRAWVLRIARNAFIDSRRRARPALGLEHGSELASAERSPEDAAILAEDRRRVLALVQRLPPVQQDALSLRFAAGLSSRQIAAVIGKSEAATKKLLTRALHALKEELHHER